MAPYAVRVLWDWGEPKTSNTQLQSYCKNSVRKNAYPKFRLQVVAKVANQSRHNLSFQMVKGYEPQCTNRKRRNAKDHSDRRRRDATIASSTQSIL